MTTITGIYKTEDELLGLFEQNRGLLLTDGPEVMNRQREAAFEHFRNAGLPAARSENYKYIDIPAMFRKEYRKLLIPQEIRFEIGDLFRCDVPELDTYLILLVNGFYHHEQAPLQELGNGIIIGSLKEAAIRYPELVGRYYNQQASQQNESLVALNTSLVRDGMFIYIPKNVTADKPFQVINMLLSEEPLFVQHRNLVILEEKSSANIVICDHTLAAHSYLTNSVTEIFAGKNAALNYTKIQNEHNDSSLVNSRFVHQEAGSNVNSTVITLHGGIVRNNLYVKLAGEFSSNTSSGLFLTDQQQHVDTFTWIEHAAANCMSNQFYKGVLDDQSTGAFSGRILVQHGAQKTNAYQKNQNILLTNEAKMNTKPQLEIYADDVKCSHGATVGQLDQEALFYMRSRGIGEQEARMLLMFAFALEITDNIGVEKLRERISELVNKRLRGELSRCHACAMHCC
jgi:Fe-S cluster assembly protein SufD